MADLVAAPWAHILKADRTCSIPPAIKMMFSTNYLPNEIKRKPCMILLFSEEKTKSCDCIKGHAAENVPTYRQEYKPM